MPSHLTPNHKPVIMVAMKSHLKSQTKLNHWRTGAGWTLQEVADVVGCSTAMLSRLERGQRRASPMFRVKMARRLEVPVADLFEVEPLEDDGGE